MGIVDTLKDVVAIAVAGGGSDSGRSVSCDTRLMRPIVRLRGPGGEMLWYDAWIHDPAGNIVA